MTRRISSQRDVRTQSAGARRAGRPRRVRPMTNFPGAAWGAPRMPDGMGGAAPHSYPSGVYPPPYPGFPPAPTVPSSGLAVTSLSLGIIALMTSPLVIGLPLGIVAVAIGLVARRRVKRGRATHGGVALAGIVLGVAAMGVGLAVGAIMAIGIATDVFNSEYQHCLLEHNGYSQYCEQYR